MKKRKKLTKKPGFHYCETWKMNIYYCIGWKQADYERYMLEEFDHDRDISSLGGNCLFGRRADGNSVVLIWIRDPEDMPALAHECTHAACNILSLRGWEPDLRNDEPLTYLVEEIFKNAPRRKK